MNFMQRIIRISSSCPAIYLILFAFLSGPEAHANLKSRVQSMVNAVAIRKAPLDPKLAAQTCRTSDPLCQTYTAKYDNKYFDIQGDCYTKSSNWYDVLRREFYEDTTIGEGNRQRTVRLTGGDFGGYDFFHGFNVIYGANRTPTQSPIIVDATYLQFFKHGGYPEGLEPIFVGTQQDMVDLVKKHHKHVKLNRMEVPLEAYDATTFVDAMWPVWGHY